MTIGRRSSNALQLNDPAVSRDHMRLTLRPPRGIGEQTGGEWLLSDLGSTHGTWLNGVPVRCNRPYHIRAGDLLVVGPWTLQVVDRRGSSAPGTTLATLADPAEERTVVSRLAHSEEEEIPALGLKLLQQCSERIHAARTEAEVAGVVLDAATAGTNFTRVVFLHPFAEDDRPRIVAFRGNDPDGVAAPNLSRALIHEAASGCAASLQLGATSAIEPAGGQRQETVVALCIPIMVESTLVGYLYLDTPHHAPQQKPTAVTCEAFPVGLARLAALGMGNIMRIDIEQRQAVMEAELEAAAEAQRWLLPQRLGQHGVFTFVGESRQGRYIGGDFFNILPLSDDRLGVIVGDVGGKGIAASVLVSASQGFLHGSLEDHADPVRAVAGINRLFHSRISHSRFLKLWVGLFDAKAQSLVYVDAGHGCAMMVLPDGGCKLLPAGSNAPVGMKPDATYEAQRVALAPGVRAFIVSDGILEQRAGAPGDDSAENTDSEEASHSAPPFGMSRAQSCLESLRSGDDEITALYAALERHAGSATFDDDATAIVIRW